MPDCVKFLTETFPEAAMSIEQVIRMTQELFIVALLVALPALVVSLVVGLVVSIFQAVTSIQDQTLSYVPRIILVGLAIVVTLGVSFQQAVAFTRRMFAYAATGGP
jgi:flagellar biosynthetic protein FliQ